MEPPQKLNGSLQRQDAVHGDLPELLDKDPGAAHVPEYLQVFPDDPSDGILPGVVAPAEPDPPSSNRLQPVRPPPPPPKSRLLSACLPDTQSLGPPTAPPRSRPPLGNKHLSLDLPDPARRLGRSWTQVEHHVSVSCGAPITFSYSSCPVFHARSRSPSDCWTVRREAPAVWLLFVLQRPSETFLPTSNSYRCCSPKLWRAVL